MHAGVRRDELLPPFVNIRAASTVFPVPGFIPLRCAFASVRVMSGRQSPKLVLVTKRRELLENLGTGGFGPLRADLARHTPPASECRQPSTVSRIVRVAPMHPMHGVAEEIHRVAQAQLMLDVFAVALDG